MVIQHFILLYRRSAILEHHSNKWPLFSQIFKKKNDVQYHAPGALVEIRHGKGHVLTQLEVLTHVLNVLSYHVMEVWRLGVSRHAQVGAHEWMHGEPKCVIP